MPTYFEMVNMLANIEKKQSLLCLIVIQLCLYYEPSTWFQSLRYPSMYSSFIQKVLVQMHVDLFQNIYIIYA